MAARRLVIVMLVLLGISTLVATLVPNRHSPPGDGAARTTRSTADPGRSPSPGAQPDGRLRTATVDVADGKAPVIRVGPGDRLLLAVRGTPADDIEIPAFGLTETMTPYAPARFDLIVERGGRFAVRAFSSGRTVATIASNAGSDAATKKGG